MNNMNSTSINNDRTGNNNVINSGDQLIPGTTWTWADAGAMQKDILREQRIERLLSEKPRRRRAVKAAAPVSSLDRLEAETGWSPADAIDEAFEARRDRRLYGNGYMH